MENGWTERIEELEAEVAKLAAEWDADRRREYGYSQQTVDALTVERDKLEAENELLRERVQSVMDKHFDETSGIYEDFKQALGEASHES